MAKLRVKWGKIELDELIEVDLSGTTNAFIEKLYEITNVPVDK